MERAILETDPPAPGEVARQIDADTAARRRSTPRQLARRLHGDLDSIVLKALRKLPERRYASAAQLSEDIKRHLDGRAVTRSEEHTSELQSLMRISYAVFCLKKKKYQENNS